MQIDPQKNYTLHETRDILRVSKSTLRSIRLDGQLTEIKIRRRVFIPGSEILNYVDRCTTRDVEVVRRGRGQQGVRSNPRVPMRELERSDWPEALRERDVPNGRVFELLDGFAGLYVVLPGCPVDAGRPEHYWGSFPSHLYSTRQGGKFLRPQVDTYQPALPDRRRPEFRGLDEAAFVTVPGYLFYKLQRRGDRTGEGLRVYEHRLLAAALIDGFEYHHEEQINHRNGVRNDNSIANLEVCTKEENLRDYKESGRMAEDLRDRLIYGRFLHQGATPLELKDGLAEYADELGELAYLTLENACWHFQLYTSGLREAQQEALAAGTCIYCDKSAHE